MKTHFTVVLVALAFTHVTSTLPALPRQGGQTTPRRIVKKVGQQQTLPHAHCSVSGPCCVLLVLRAACSTLCACCAHSSIGALPRLPHCFRHASARRGCCGPTTRSRSLAFHDTAYGASRRGAGPSSSPFAMTLTLTRHHCYSSHTVRSISTLV